MFKSVLPKNVPKVIIKQDMYEIKDGEIVSSIGDNMSAGHDSIIGIEKGN